MHWALFVRYYKHLIIGSIDGNVICNNFEYRLIVSANFNQRQQIFSGFAFLSVTVWSFSLFSIILN